MCIQEGGGGIFTFLAQPYGLARVRRSSSSKSKREGEPPLWTRERKVTPVGQKVERDEESPNAHLNGGALYLTLVLLSCGL